jgi:hypothetical protein
VEPVVASGTHEDGSSAPGLVVEVDHMALERHLIVVTTRAAVVRCRLAVVEHRVVAPDGTEQPPRGGVRLLRRDGPLDLSHPCRIDSPRGRRQRETESTLYGRKRDAVRIEAGAVELDVIRSSGAGLDKVPFDDRRLRRADHVENRVPGLAILGKLPLQVPEVSAAVTEQSRDRLPPGTDDAQVVSGQGSRSGSHRFPMMGSERVRRYPTVALESS